MIDNHLEIEKKAKEVRECYSDKSYGINDIFE